MVPVLTEQILLVFLDHLVRNGLLCLAGVMNTGFSAGQRIPEDKKPPNGKPDSAWQIIFWLENYYFGIYVITYFLFKIYLYINTIAEMVLSRKNLKKNPG